MSIFKGYPKLQLTREFFTNNCKLHFNARLSNYDCAKHPISQFWPKFLTKIVQMLEFLTYP